MKTTILSGLLLLPSLLWAQPPQLSHPTPAGTAHEMVLIPEGNFWMGMADSAEQRLLEESESVYLGPEDLTQNKPIRQIFLDAYYIDQYEVTQAQYAAYAQAVGGVPLRNPPLRVVWDGTTPAAGYADHPVVALHWDEARAYCGWAGLHLPTEAQWEKAARGTDARLYPWGNEAWIEGHGDGNRWVTDRAQANGEDALFVKAMRDLGQDWPYYEIDSDGYAWTAPVGSFPQGVSPYGAFDMAGNIGEWMADAFDADYYASMPSVNPYNDDDAYQFKSVRGGGYGSAESEVALLTFHRAGLARDGRAGCRCAGDVSISATSVLPQSWGQVKVQVRVRAEYARKD